MLKKKLRKLRRFLKKSRIDSILVTNPANVRYLSGFSGSDSWLFITKTQNFFISDFRYKLQAEQEIDSDFEIRILQDSIFLEVKKIADGAKIRSIYFEANNLTYNQYSRLKNTLKARITLEPSSGIIEKQRLIKNTSELAQIKKAMNITKKSLKTLSAFIRPGISELFLKNKLEQFLKENGAEKPAFDIIVASGPNAAMPHARATERKIGANEPVIIDVGADYNGYKSDLTRTFFSGKITQYIKYQKVVAAAQDRAIKMIKPGITIRKIDAAAREVLKEAGLDSYFGHALGHGVGLDVHEAPVISNKNKKRLAMGMVFTVEPGIYIPGSGGIRIEDMVVVTEKGCEIL